MGNPSLRQLYFKYGWDTRCRNLDSLRGLRSVLGRTPLKDISALLDVGSGSRGVAAFLPDISVTCVDLEPAYNPESNITVKQGNITALPFSEERFPIVCCIDVLEHLSPEERGLAIKELVRVTEKHLVIAFPHGRRAKECDKRLLNAYQTKGEAPPNWVVEHQKHPYPDPAYIEEKLSACARASGRSIRTAISYSEPITLTRILRETVIRSRLLYMVINILLGAIYPTMFAPSADSSYRAILVVTIDD